MGNVVYNRYKAAGHFILLLLLALLAACGESSDPLSPSGRATIQASAATEQAESPTTTAVSPDVEGSQENPAQQPAQPVPPGAIPAGDPHIRYTGRFDFNDPRGPRYDWPAVMIEAAFEGTSIAAFIDDEGGNSYDVNIDGQTSVLHTVPGQTRYVLAEGLRGGEHNVRLVKRTETFYGTPQFLGFELDANRELLSLPHAPERRIEFIGDSITAGYGVEGTSPTCIFSKETENAARTYAAQTAGYFDADYHVIAVSGLGVVRNYNSEGAMSAGTMLSYYGRTLANETEENWNFAEWQPDAVVINLGTNDFSTTPHPAGEVFLQGYTNLIFKVRERYPETHIFTIAGPIMVGPAEDTIRSVVAQMNEVLGDERVYYVPIENTLELTDVDYGCDWHPNEHGQAKIAEQLIPAMSVVLGW